MGSLGRYGSYSCVCLLHLVHSYLDLIYADIFVDFLNSLHEYSKTSGPKTLVSEMLVKLKISKIVVAL